MKNKLISFQIEKNEEGALDAFFNFSEDITNEKLREEIKQFVNKSILRKLPEELASMHEQNDLPIFDLIISGKGIFCSSVYLGFFSEEDKKELEIIITDLIKELSEKYKKVEEEKGHRPIILDADIKWTLVELSLKSTNSTNI